MFSTEETVQVDLFTMEICYWFSGSTGNNHYVALRRNFSAILFGINMIIGSAILLIGDKINSETKDIEIK